MAGGEGTGRPRDGTSRAGWIPCVICQDTIGLDQYLTARCWVDPNGITCAAHAACLKRLGERDLELR